MKCIIDLIEDMREQISNDESYSVAAGLLKEDIEDSSKLIYTGEAMLNRFYIDDTQRKLRFKIDGSDTKITVKELISSVLILGLDMMMYELKMDVNKQYKNMEIVGFGKNDEQKRYILFIKI